MAVSYILIDGVFILLKQSWVSQENVSRGLVVCVRQQKDCLANKGFGNARVELTGNGHLPFVQSFLR